MKIDNFNYVMLQSENKKLFTFVNPYSYGILMEKKSSFLNDFNILSDGILFVTLYNFFNENKINRYSFDFTSLAPVVFSYASKYKLRVALVGGTENEINKAKIVINNKYPKLNIVLSHHGFIKGNVNDVIDMMKDKEIQVVISGLGTPFQEEFLINCQKNIDSLKLGFTCGGFLTQISNNENYFHPFFDKLNLRWLQRFLRHSYVRKRLFIDYPIFVFKYIFENAFKK